MSEKRMSLYEIFTGAMGESYVRLYAWTETEGQAIELALIQLKIEAPDIPSEHHALSIHRLFSSDAEAFCTPSDDSGFYYKWGDEPEEHCVPSEGWAIREQQRLQWLKRRELGI